MKASIASRLEALEERLIVNTPIQISEVIVEPGETPEAALPSFTPEEEEEIVSMLASVGIWEPLPAGQRVDLKKLSDQQLERLLELYEAEEKREKERGYEQA